MKETERVVEKIDMEVEELDARKSSSSSWFKRIGVFGGSSPGKKIAYQQAAIDLAEELVERRIDLVYGGGSLGLMGVLSQAVHDGGLHVIGVVPKSQMELIFTTEPVGEVVTVNYLHERKALMAREADAFIGLPGGYGTLEELLEVISGAQLNMHRKLVGLLNVDGFFNSLLSLIDKAVDEGFISPIARRIVVSAPTPKQLLTLLEEQDKVLTRRRSDETEISEVLPSCDMEDSSFSDYEFVPDTSTGTDIPDVLPCDMEDSSFSDVEFVPDTPIGTDILDVLPCDMEDSSFSDVEFVPDTPIGTDIHEVLPSCDVEDSTFSDVEFVPDNPTGTDIHEVLPCDMDDSSFSDYEFVPDTPTGTDIPDVLPCDMEDFSFSDVEFVPDTPTDTNPSCNMEDSAFSDVEFVPNTPTGTSPVHRISLSACCHGECRECAINKENRRLLRTN